MIKDFRKTCSMDICYQWSQWWINYWKNLWKKLQKTNQQGFRILEPFREKGISYMSNGKYTIIHLVPGLTKKDVTDWNSIV